MKQESLKNGLLTTRYGRLDMMITYSYIFTEKILAQKDKKAKLINWLRKNPDVPWLKFTSEGFESYEKLKKSNWQYNFKGTNRLIGPFENTSNLSAYLKKITDQQLLKNYKIFRDFYVLETIKVGLFCILKGFSYNIEVMSDGKFLIHFKAESAITFPPTYIKELILNKVEASSEEHVAFTLFNQSPYQNLIILPGETDAVKKVQDFITNYPSSNAITGYKFAERYFPTLVKKILASSKNNTNKVVNQLKEVSSCIKEWEGVRLYNLPFLPVKLKNMSDEMVLLTGQKKKASKCSATYFNGIYLPVRNRSILIITDQKLSYLSERIRIIADNHFNKGGHIEWLKSILIDDAINNPEIVTSIEKSFEKLHVIIVTTQKITKSFIDFLKHAKIKFHFYSGSGDQYSLSNFIVSVLAKAGGITTLIMVRNHSKNCAYLGLDLGHDHRNANKKSILAAVGYDQHGMHAGSAISENLKLNEVINSTDLTLLFQKIKNKWLQRYSALPECIYLHRDGRLHTGEIDAIVSTVKYVFKTTDIHIAEVIKSGYPYMVCYDTAYKNPDSGSCWLLESYNYAILITNDQGTDHDELLNPIIIKLKYGTVSLSNLVSDIYWLSKVHSPSLYHATRLPVTTNRADSLASTGKK